MISAMVTAIFAFYLENVTATIMEKCSHLAHSHAQNKIGSGFDISCAFNGSHIFSRFSPKILFGDDVKNIIDSRLECRLT